MQHTIPVLACAASVLLAIPLAAQCSVKSHLQLLNDACNVNGDLRIDTGWQTAVPQVTPASQTRGTFPTCYSTASVTMVADYGYLRYTGNGQAASPLGLGTALVMRNWIGAEPNLQFQDSVLVVAPLLAPGTPVQLRGTVQLASFSAITGNNATLSDYRVRFQVTNALGAEAVVNNTTGVASVTVTVAVGQTVPVLGRLYVDQRAYTAGLGTSSIQCDFAATFDLTALTPGVALQSCSGTTYNGLAARVTPVGFGCGIAPPTLAATPPMLGGISTMQLAGAQPNAPVLHAYALGAAVPLPVGPCMLYVDAASAVVDAVGVASPAGQLAFPLAIPSSVNLLNFRLTAQSVPLATNGPFVGLAELSNGLELRVGY